MLEIGSANGDVALKFVTGATRLPDGSVMVADRDDYALRVFSPAGKLVKSFGRNGSGPGEIRYLARMFRCGDSVYTYDIQEGRRVSVFTLTGQYVRAFRWTAPAGQPSAYASACNAAGVFVHMGWERREDMRGGIFRSIVPVWTSRADTVIGTVVDSIPGSERWGTVSDNQLRGTSPLPLGKQTVIGIGRSQIYLGAADRFEVRAASTSGRGGVVLRRSEPPAPATEQDWLEARELEVSRQGEASRARVIARYAEMKMPPTLPAYSKLIVDARDLVWIRHEPRGAPELVRWSVFDPGGRLLAEVEVPARLEVYEIGADYLLGRYVDSGDGTAQVRVYRLNRDSSR